MITLDPAAVAELCRRHRIAELALFGSAVRADFSPESDVDVLVEFSPDAHVGFIALGRIQDELERLIGRRVDIVTKRSLNHRIRDEVLAERRILYVEAQ